MLPPPAPIVWMSIVGIDTGNVWNCCSVSTFACPPAIRRRVEARASHVDRDQVLVAEDLAQRGRADHAARRSGEHEVHGLLLRRRDGHRAAARARQQEAAAEVALLEVVVERVEVRRRDRLDVRVDDRGARPLVLAVLAAQPVRERHRRRPDIPRAEPPPSRARALDRRSCGGSRRQPRSTPSSRILPRGGHGALAVERDENRPVVRAALGDLEDEVPRDERRRAPVLEVVHRVAIGAADLVDVAESARRHDRHARAGSRRAAR